MIFARLYFPIQAARRSVVAIWSCDHTIRADRPLFSLVRNRPIARRRRQRRRGNRTRGSVSRPISVICLAELAARGEKRKHARNCRTECRLGAVASLECPAAFFIPERRKQMAARKLSDVAVSAVSPLFFPQRHPPLGRTKATSAKNLSEALRRLRRRCVSTRQLSPSRRNETDARTSSQRSRH